MTVSVLMSTYAKDNAEHFAEALESIYHQTVRPDEIVLVVDGPVDGRLEDVIARFQSDERIPVMKIVRQPKQSGLAAALDRGLAECVGDFVMRMDSDDVSMPTRLMNQLAYAESHPEVSLVAAWAYEFTDSMNAPMAVKTAPEGGAPLIDALRWRNVICHPTVLIRRDDLIRVGGYRSTFDKLEDYDLFVRLALANRPMKVLQIPLLYVRVSLEQRKRRGGWRYVMYELKFRWFCLQSGFLTNRQFLTTTACYASFRLVPAWTRHYLYRFARKQPIAIGAKMTEEVS
jgi:glycosyltransferase involved in cell wall biosynthesis